MPNVKNMTFLKVLTAFAWADGEVTQSELNVLKNFYLKFGLTPDQVKELQPYLEAPLSKEDQEKLCRQLICELDTAREKLDIMRALESMAQADHIVSDEEKVLLDQFSKWLAEASFTRKSFGKIRNYLVGTLFKPAREKNPALEKYFKNRVLKNIEVKAARQGETLNLPEDQIYRICLLGTLLASVANIDERIDESEKEAIKRVLQKRHSFSPDELRILFEVVEEQARRGFDFHEIVTELNAQMSYNDRLNLVDCFFAVAAADGDISYEETEEIRRITKALRIPHKNFIDAKVKALSALRGNGGQDRNL